MAGFSKLFSSIVTSSVWVEDHKTLRVWIAMLALKDAHGVVEGSIPGLANLCQMTIQEMEESITKLESPDHYSRSKEHEGRRIQKTDGGWLVLNHETYRNKGQDKSGSRASYMRRYRTENVTRNTVTSNVTDVTPELLRVRTDTDTDIKEGANAPTLWDIAESLKIPRSFCGKLIKQYGEPAVAAAVAAVSTKRPADPKQWVVGFLRKNNDSSPFEGAL